jgi:hypothetical protein
MTQWAEQTGEERAHGLSEGTFDLVKAGSGAAGLIPKLAPGLLSPEAGGAMAGLSGGIAIGQSIDNATAMLTGGRTLSDMTDTDLMPFACGAAGSVLGTMIPEAAPFIAGAGNISKGVTGALRRVSDGSDGLPGDAARFVNRHTAGPIPHIAAAVDHGSANREDPSRVGDALTQLLLPGIGTGAMLAKDVLDLIYRPSGEP